LVNKTRCEPENECLDARSCSQRCTDEKHGFTCSCDDGYTLDTDKRTCKVTDNVQDMRIYVSNRNRIYWSDSHLENWRTFAALVENAIALAWDSVDDKIYWSDIREKKIFVATRNGTNATTFIADGLDITEGISLDWVQYIIHFHCRSYIYGTFGCYLRNDYLLLYKKSSDIREKKIFVATRNGTNATTFIADGLDITEGISLDWVARNLYWVDSSLNTIEVASLERPGARSDIREKKIFVATRNGTNATTFIADGLDITEGISLDWVARNLYWVDSSLNTIEVASLERPGARAVLIHENVDQPRGIAVDPRKGLLFWTDWGQRPRIERAYMDGSDRHILVDTKIYWPNTIALDLTTNRVYFADSKLDYIDFVNYDGTGRTQVLSSPKFVQHPHALAIFEDMIYYSDRRLQRLQVYPKYPNGTSGDYPSHTFSKALGVTATHPVLQPKVHSNPCAGNPCSHLCLIGKEMSYTCKCPMGKTLDASGKKCVNDLKPFLLLIQKTNIFGVQMDDVINATPAMAGMIPLAGLNNAYDASYDPESFEVYYLELPISGRVIGPSSNAEARIMKISLNSSERIPV
uniref:EGF-like domain-containing protein n=1 Tax=Ascaris lumbricoides TaxID=6252 RepID=A0A0M3IQI1_ASCLU